MPIVFANPSHGEFLARQSMGVGNTGWPTDFPETFSAAWESSRLLSRYIGEELALEEEYDRHIAETFRATGKRLPNPIRRELPLGQEMAFPVDPMTGQHSRADALRLFHEGAGEGGIKPPSADDFRKRAYERMAGLEATRGDVLARSSGAWATFGGFLGDTAAVMTDPLVLGSMMFGGGAAGVVRTMAREALLAGGTEAVLQPQIQGARARAGLPAGIGLGLENVAVAAGGAAALSGAFLGAGAAYRALRGDARKILEAREGADPALVEAARYAERQADLQSRNPLPETAAGTAEHVERVSAAQRSLSDPDAGGPETRLRDEPQSPVAAKPRVTAAIPENETPAMAAVREIGEKMARLAREGAEGLDQFRATRAAARSLGDLSDESIVIAREPSPVLPRGDMSLIQFIKAKGGINDYDRALASIGVTARLRPWLIRKTGLSAGRLSELAAEAGYFPAAGSGEGSRSVDQRELASAISDEIGGEKLYPVSADLEALADFEARGRIHADVNQAFDELGIDAKTMTNAQVRAAIRAHAEAPDPAPEVRTDYEAEAIANAERNNADLDYQAEFEERLAMAAESMERERFAGRMDEKIDIEVNGEKRTVTAREIFKNMDEDERLVAEFQKCIESGGEVPF